MKWHNLNVAIRIKISSGTALLIWLIAFFGVLAISKWIPAVAENVILILTALTTGMGGYLVKDHKSNQLDVEAAEKNLGAKLDSIKRAAAGEVINGDCGKTGDPLT